MTIYLIVVGFFVNLVFPVLFYFLCLLLGIPVESASTCKSNTRSFYAMCFHGRKAIGTEIEVHFPYQVIYEIGIRTTNMSPYFFCTDGKTTYDTPVWIYSRCVCYLLHAFDTSWGYNIFHASFATRR